ncbi:MAG: ATP-binding protein [Oscillospiraceae bacterium]|nr:ATP-binding protein [Oscillospiraceae bacterium]
MQKQKKQVSLMSRFIIFSIVFFFIIISSGSVAFILSMRQITRKSKSAELTHILEIEQLQLETLVNNEIAIALKLADSPLVKRYFFDPVGSAQLKDIVFEEIAAYRHFFKEHMVFFISDADKMFYSDDNAPYPLDIDDPENYWYYMTLRETEVYNFNINYNPDLNVTNLWVNAPVFSQNRVAIGMVGTGINLSKFIDSIYDNYEHPAELYFFNKAGEITGAKDVSIVSEKHHLEDEMEKLGQEIYEAALDLKPGEVKLIYTRHEVIAIRPVETLDWYSVVIYADSIEDYNNPLTALFVIVIVVVALIFVISNAFISRPIRSLRNTMESLRVASQAKSDFLSNMSHEIRTPMNAIIGMTTIAASTDDVEKKNNAIGKINDASKFLLSIINDILDMSKIEAGKFELSPITFDINDMVQQVIVINRFNIEAKKQQLTVNVDEDIPQDLFGDEQRLGQVTTNLMSNAVKFTPQNGSIGLSVKLINQDSSNCTIEISVSDTGIGMSEEQQEKIFQSFQQADSSTSRNYGGTGLGLAISKGIIEMMDGHISVNSELGRGSTFIFTVILKRCEQQEHRRIETKNISQDNSSIDGIFEGYRILLAEDVEINREIVMTLLAPTHLSIDCAVDGQEALELFKQNHEQYDLILMDIQMPKMDGLEVTKCIRLLDLPNAKTIPIIAMTANVFREDIDRYIEASMEEHLGKPLDFDDVLRVLKKYLSVIDR